jgi:hypothetical protein
MAGNELKFFAILRFSACGNSQQSHEIFDPAGTLRSAEKVCDLRSYPASQIRKLV